MSTKQFLFSGFGGQGILFAGKFMAYKGLMDGKQVSWLPSYGPEMRGGTASCGVIVSDDAVGSPIVSNPDVLVAMNLPSFDKFEPTVKAGGLMIVDSSLVAKKSEREDIKVCKINVDEQPELANQFQIMTIPTLMVFKGGQVVNQASGARPKNQILSML